MKLDKVMEIGMTRVDTLVAVEGVRDIIESSDDLEILRKIWEKLKEIKEMVKK